MHPFISTLSLILLQTPPAGGGAAPGAAPPAGGPAPAGPNPFSTIIMFGAIIAVFYFFMIRPQQKKQRAERQFRESLKKGDKVITIGGAYGRVASIEDNGIILEMDTNVKIRFDKSAVRPVPETADDKK